MEHLHALPTGTMIQEYRIEAIIGEGGFGITYRAWDTSLAKRVAIKEYFPSSIAVRGNADEVLAQSSGHRDDFNWGLERFIDEARTLARFRHPNIIEIYRFFESHSTAYIVMEYAEGGTLAQQPTRFGDFNEDSLAPILFPLLEGLSQVHSAQVLHRDIKPSNIIIRPDGSPVLLDFGAARNALADRSRSLTSIVTTGFAPIEQYSSRGNQGPWSDIYALAGVAYQCLTGRSPDAATDRIRNDPLVPLGQLAAHSGSSDFIRAIEAGLNPFESDRPQTIEEWKTLFGGGVLPHVPQTSEVQSQATGTGSPPSSMRPWAIGGALALVLVVAVVSLFVVSEQNAQRQLQLQDQAQWQQADSLGTIESYQDYLRLMPEGLYRDEASREIRRLEQEADEAEWQVAVSENSIEAYTAYLTNQPNGAFRNDAEAAQQRLIEEREAEQTRLRDAEAQRALVTAIQEELARLGYPIGSADGAFGPATQRALQDFITASGVDELAEPSQSALSRLRVAEIRPDHRAGFIYTDCEGCPEMIVVPTGRFRLGSPRAEVGRNEDEGPQKRITFSEPFSVSRFEVTFEQWDQCYSEGGCRHRPDDQGRGRGDRPVVDVNWNDANAYVSWISRKSGNPYRLLSEAEWEYTSKAGTDGAFSFGSNERELCEHGNVADLSARSEFPRWRVVECRDGFVFPAPVGSYRANSFGVYDLYGNVREWVQDCFKRGYEHLNQAGEAHDPSGCEIRVFRGGGWIDVPQLLRSSNRNGAAPDDRNARTGFRIARTM